MSGSITPFLSQMLADCGVSATRILEAQISAAINESGSAVEAFEGMPAPLVCWYLGYRIANLAMLESMAADLLIRKAEATLTFEISTFLTRIATLNSRLQPDLAEMAMATVDGFNDQLMRRPVPQALVGEDMSYGGLVPPPMEGGE